MRYILSSEEKEGYILFEVTGERIRGQEAKDALEIWEKIGEMCNAKKIFKALVIFNLKGDLRTMVAYKSGLSIADIDSLHNLKIAFIDLNTDSSKVNRFSETVAANRIDISESFNMFDDENEAIEWLLK
jgi:hypothetical protein